MNNNNSKIKLTKKVEFVYLLTHSIFILIKKSASTTIIESKVNLLFIREAKSTTSILHIKVYHNLSNNPFKMIPHLTLIIILPRGKFRKV